MTSEQLTAILAERVMGWSVGPDRFMIGHRGWIPRWRFQPTEHLVDAFKLLEGAGPDQFTMSGTRDGSFRVAVRISGTAGEAVGSSKALVITHAIARAIGVEPGLAEGTATPAPAVRKDRRNG